MMNEMGVGSAGGMGARKVVYTVTEKGEKSFWTKLGVAFTNRDGSITIRLEAVPVNGTLIVRDDDLSRRAVGGAT